MYLTDEVTSEKTKRQRLSCKEKFELQNRVIDSELEIIEIVKKYEFPKKEFGSTRIQISE